MRLTLRTKLLAILGVLTLAFAVLLVTGAASDARVEQQLRAIARQHVPDLELGPKLGAEFANLRRALQDAVSAEDAQALEDTHRLRDQLIRSGLAAARPGSPLDTRAFESALNEYYGAAYEVSRRLLAHEAGHRLLDAMAAMQAKDARTTKVLEQATRRAQQALGKAYERAAASQASLRNTRLAISLGCLSIVLLLSLWLSQHILRAVTELGAGLLRFGGSNFREPIRFSSGDEFGDLASKANEMARNLERLQGEREQADWQKTGHTGLVLELQGDIEPSKVAERAVRFLARYLRLPAAALYQVEVDGALVLLAHYGAVAADGALPARLAAGDGLLGTAAREREITVVRALPQSYLKIRSGLGEASPQGVAFLPLVHLDKVVGVMELAFFDELSEEAIKLLDASRETLAITLEVARSRTAVRSLLAETQNQAMQLSAQEEELRATNDELQRQQEELRDINAELTQQATALELQRRELELSNAELTEARHNLEKKADELTTVSAYKSQFLANMSHELRTPLNSMLVLSNLLAENEGRNLSEKQVEYCRTVNQAGQDLLALINQVLDLSKVEAGKQSIFLETVSFESLAQHSRRLFEPLARQRGLGLEVELAVRELPATFVTDPKRVEQILNNLIGNAIKFTERGRVTLRIAPASADAGPASDGLSLARAVALAVSDTGVGISPEDQQRIFMPFEQLESTSDRRYGGTGLGLTIAREMAVLLGGELQLRSAVGQGSTFTLLLPLDTPLPAKRGTPSLPARVSLTPAREAQDLESPEPGANEAAPELLVIEDDPVFRAALCGVIREQQVSYIVAEDGETGLRLARRHKPRGIVLDVGLSDIDGFTLMEKLRADSVTRTIPVYFASALDAPEHGLALGAVGYLTKPASRDDLVAMVKSLVPARADACRVLIIEDDPTLAESLQQCLRSEGFEAQRVGSAREGLARLASEAFQCLILDLGLPDMDGLDLLASLARPGRDGPAVVVYTGRALNKRELQRLRGYTESIVMKDGNSTERLLDELRALVERLKRGPVGEAEAAFPAPQAGAWQGKTVLVADDDMRALYSICALLRSRGIEPLVADNGASALDVLMSHPEVHAVLLDVMMPEMDGFEAMRRVRSIPALRAVPIIALTAKTMKDDEQRCLEAGASGYLSKPLDPQRLFALLESVWSADTLSRPGSAAP